MSSSECLNLAFESVRFLFVALGVQAKLTKVKVDTADELLARVLDPAANIKKREDQMRRTTRDLHTRFVKCVEVGGGIWERLL